MHDISHQLGVLDHYHESGTEDASGKCDHTPVCSDCGDTARPNWCIMKNTSQDMDEMTDVFLPGM